MKTNRLARPLLKVRIALICLAIVGLAGGEVVVSKSLASRCPQMIRSQTGTPPVPNVNFGEFMATAGVR
jgi:hypothetical protein